MLEGHEVKADGMKSLELGAFLSVLGSVQFLSYLILLPLPALFSSLRTFP